MFRRFQYYLCYIVVTNAPIHTFLEFPFIGTLQNTIQHDQSNQRLEVREKILMNHVAMSIINPQKETTRAGNRTSNHKWLPISFFACFTLPYTYFKVILGGKLSSGRTVWIKVCFVQSDTDLQCPQKSSIAISNSRIKIYRSPKTVYRIMRDHLYTFALIKFLNIFQLISANLIKVMANQ